MGLPLEFILLLSFIILFRALPAEGQQKNALDFSGVEQFFRITSILEQDREPTPAHWDSLFETPGYEVLTSSEFSRDFFTRNFRLAFMPSKSHELDKALNEEAGRPEHTHFLSHYLKAQQNREALLDYTDSLQAHATSLISDAARSAMAFLPPMQPEEGEFIPVSFLIFSRDARGYTPVVIDVLFAKDLGDQLSVLVAHELHHYYRNMILAYDREEVEDADKDFLWVLDQVQAEGIADQIDKRMMVMDKDGAMHAFADRWRAMVAAAPEYLKSFDQVLRSVDPAAPDLESAGQKLRNSLPVSGHPVGFYMANIILEYGAKDTMIAQVGNPFAFFRLYQKAAQSTDNKAPVFSDATLAIISNLEKKYGGDY